MKWIKKLPHELQEYIVERQLTELGSHEQLYFQRIREGLNFFLSTGREVDFTSILGWSLLMKSPEPMEGSPRAILICADSDEAERVFELIKIPAKKMDLTVDFVHDKGNKLKQRNEIFDGTEIIVGTLKRVYELYLQNGINLNLLRLIQFSRLDELTKGSQAQQISRICEGLPLNCQLTFTGKEKSERILQLFHQIPQDVRLFSWQQSDGLES